MCKIVIVNVCLNDIFSLQLFLKRHQCKFCMLINYTFDWLDSFNANKGMHIVTSDAKHHNEQWGHRYKRIRKCGLIVIE